MSHWASNLTHTALWHTKLERATSLAGTQVARRLLAAAGRQPPAGGGGRAQMRGAGGRAGGGGGGAGGADAETFEPREC